MKMILWHNEPEQSTALTDQVTVFKRFFHCGSVANPWGASKVWLLGLLSAAVLHNPSNLSSTFYGSFFELSVMAGAFTCPDQHVHSLKWRDASWDALSLMGIQRSLRIAAGLLIK